VCGGPDYKVFNFSQKIKGRIGIEEKANVTMREQILTSVRKIKGRLRVMPIKK